ncbi:ATP-binding protein [Sphingomonas sp.]|uniref:AlbA family DNA-binding domain-containing protein n=1 Tax=Sphingomonas sp. TaxID=28214 RepID=UPI0031D90D7F
MPRYNPFQRPFEELEAADLVSLQSASEGWYVEYKREASKADTMAKSVSAFANTHGGWLFYGIAEKSKQDAVAGEFPGIPKVDVDAALQRLRQSVANSINPSPHYEVRAIWGPNLEIGLAADHAVICVYVPKGPNSPYVHKSGQIYRRVADGSEPKPENDRFVLDQLWRRSDLIRKEYEEWVERDPEFSKIESDLPYIRLLMVADLWGDRDAWLDAPYSEVRKILKAEETEAYAVPFDTVYTSANGFVGRQLRENNPRNLGLTYRLRRDLVSELIIPMTLHTPSHLYHLRNSLIGYHHTDQFCDIFEQKNYPNPKVVDLNFVLNILMAAANLQGALLERAGWVHGYHCKAVLLNVWRSTPFLDSPAILREYEKHGVPMMMDGRVVSRPGSNPESFKPVGQFADVEQPSVKFALQGLDMFWLIAEAYGVPMFEAEGDAQQTSFMGELLKLGTNAIRAQSARKAQNEE